MANITSILARGSKALQEGRVSSSIPLPDFDLPQDRRPSTRRPPSSSDTVVSDVSTLPNGVRPTDGAARAAAREADTQRISTYNPPTTEEPDMEDFDGATEVPPHVKGTRGVQIRNACITYWPEPPVSNKINERTHGQLSIQQYAGLMLKPSHKDITFYASCLEVAPSTGRIHGHLYIEFKDPKTTLQIKKIVKEAYQKTSDTTNDKCFIYMRRGTQQQALDYVLKVGKYADKAYTQLSVKLSHLREITDEDAEALKPHVCGAQKHQGTRSDLDRYVEMAFDGVQRNEFLAAEKGAGLRYFKYFSDACNVIDGLDRGDTIRANKRVAYDKYLLECDDKGVVPCKFFEFRCEHDSKWNEESQTHYISTMSAAVEEREFRDDVEREGALNKVIEEGNEDDEMPELIPALERPEVVLKAQSKVVRSYSISNASSDDDQPH